ncbi:MAG: membrane protein insertion efficiency factor YidD [Parvibaculaceae bacterium]
MCERHDEQEKRQARGPVALVLLGLIRMYQLTVSAVLGRRCRYLPTCSDYAAEAIRLHGAWAGFWLGLARISRCHPWGGEGFDPVPGKFPETGWRAWRHVPWRLK